MKLLKHIRNSKWFPRTEQSLGDRGERAAIRYLKKKGYLIIAASENLGVGEIDIIAVDRSRVRRGGKRVVVFVEVKTRTSTGKGQPTDAVDDRKQKQISRAAMTYIRRHALEKCATRFDVVSIIWPMDSRKPEIEHFESAFEAVTGEYD